MNVFEMDPTMSEVITVDDSQKLFVIRMQRSFYALRALPDGQVVHVGSGPLAPDAGPLHLAGLDGYEDPNYVCEQQGRRAELLAFGDISYHDVGLKVAFLEVAGQLPKGHAPHLPVRDVRLRYQRHEIRTDAAPGLSPTHGRAIRRAAVLRPVLIVHLQDAAYDFRVRLCYRVTPEYDIIERWVELENQTAQHVAVESLAFASIHFPPGRYELTRSAGAWAREFVPVRQNIEQGVTEISHRGLNTGHASNPFYMVHEHGSAGEDAGAVYFGALAFSGNWSLRFEMLPTDALRMHGGYEATDFSLTLGPGAVHRTPALVHGVADNGIGGASRRLHAFARDYVLPGYQDDQFRPVLFNSWEATYFDITLEGQINLARAAAQMGVELFCLDDGWFGSRRHDRAGLGDWAVSQDLFPNGLTPLIEAVKELGMRFGLWVEPEMINPDSDLYRAHPDWVLHFPGRPRTEARNQLVLDYGRPEVVEHIFAALDGLLSRYDITFFKWDMNRYASEPGSVVGKAIWHAHVAGLYSIMDRLRQAHPRLDIQSCAGGGGRVDLGILGRCDQVWTSDNTDPFDRAYIQDGFSLAYPPRVMEAWVTHDHNHQTGRVVPLDLRFDLAMRGALGIGSNIDKLSADERAAYRRKIGFYKTIRPVVQNGDLYRLARVQDGGVSVWQTVLPDQSQSVYSIAVIQQLQGHHLPAYRLRALAPAAIYAVRDENGARLGRYSGAQLMALGMPGDQRNGGLGCAVRSRTLLLEKVADQEPRYPSMGAET